MKLRNKILAIVAPAATIAAIAPIALTSCNNGNTDGPTTITYSGSKEFGITSNTFTLDLMLDKELPQYWQIIPGGGSTSGDFVVAPKSDVTISGKKVTVTFGTIGSLQLGKKSTFTFTITCRNDKIKDVFKVTFSGFKVTYQGE